jgi:hypothetical protein
MSDTPPPSVTDWRSHQLGEDSTNLRLYKWTHYRHHKDQLPRLERIFNALRTPMPFGALTALATMTGIRTTTLSTWKQRLAVDEAWRPSRLAYGAWRRVFTDDQECLLLNNIVSDYLAQGLYYSHEAFKLDALAFHWQLCHEAE